MFDQSYDFEFKGSQKPNAGDHFFQKYIFTFKCRFNNRYIVNVEKYEFDIFVVKFHLKAHSDSENKYNLLTGLNDVGRIVRTCINIMLHFYEENEFSSFGFIGSNLINEEISDTKRFRIYSKVMENFFSPLKFNHYKFPGKSAYLLLNKANEKHCQLDKVQKMFLEFYEV